MQRQELLEKWNQQWGKSGQHDVSEHITCEDQLLGNSDRPNEDQDASSKVSNKNDKGTEMSRFIADMSSVSEYFEEENDENGDGGQLEPAMGKAGAEYEVIAQLIHKKLNFFAVESWECSLEKMQKRNVVTRSGVQ